MPLDKIIQVFFFKVKSKHFFHVFFWSTNFLREVNETKKKKVVLTNFTAP
jgi:hypothetical protein